MALTVSAAIGAVLCVLIYCIGLWAVNVRLGMELPTKRGIPCTVSSVVAGIIALVGSFAVGMLGSVYEDWSELIGTMLLLSGLAVVTVTDIEKHMIPNMVLKAMLLLWVALTGITMICDIEYGMELLFRGLAGALAGGAVFMLCYLISRKQIGAGDVKLVFVMGIYLTGKMIMGAVFYGVLICCIYSIVQLARKKIGVKDGVPLAPFLYAGTIVTMIIMEI